jgi:hypothetical protein
MKLLGNTMKALLVPIVLCLLLTSCTKPAGYGYFSTLYRSENESDYKTVANRLKDWLLSSGFSSAQSPGGVAEWSGSHTKDEITSWYSLPVDGHQILLRISLDPHSKQIEASTDYGGNFTKSQLQSIKKSNLKIWDELFTWTEAQQEKNEVTVHTPDWFIKARQNATQAYTK